MAAVAFDTLKFARRLREAGVPEAQAEAQAELMAEAFLFNLNALVTKDYLEARLAEFEARIDTRFAEVDGKFRLLFWMVALNLAVATIPALKALLSS